MTMSTGFFIRVAVAFFVLFVPAQSIAQEVVTVRHGDHPTFSRIVFDWQEDVEYTPRLVAGRLEITFNKAARPDWGSLPNEPLNFLAEPEYHMDGNNLVVSLKMTRPGKLSHFRYGKKIAFDISETDISETDILGDAVSANDSGAADVTPATVSDMLPDGGNDTTSRVTEGDGEMTVRIKRQWDSLRLTYPWEEDVRAAAFIRHNQLWVVFEGKKTINQRDLDRFIGQRVLSVRQLDHPTMTILVYRVTPGQNIKVQKINRHWHIDLKSSRTAPAQPIPSSHQRSAGSKGENFFYSADNAGVVLMVEDPVIGDELAIIPVMESSQGVLQLQKFTEFTSLPTAQGIAVQLIADNIDILKYRNGVSVATGEGLALSPSQLSGKLGLIPVEDEAVDSTAKLVDFPLWAKGPLEGQDYHANKHELLYMLANSTDTNRNEIRWRLAKFYLANGRRREAFAVLNVMLDEDSRLIANPEFRTVLAVTNILMRRFDEGAKLLVHKALIGQQDVFLWRAVANSALGNHKLAFENYKKGSDTLSLQAPENRIAFLFAAIRSAYALGEKDFVEFSLSMMKNLPLSAAQLTEVDYWRALLERDSGDILKAEETLRGLVKAGVRQTAAWAKLDLINMDLESKKIDGVEAIDQLEKLRFSWRGDDFELELLSRLGDLYVAQNDFNTGLQTLKLAVTFFGGSPKTVALTRQMTRIYSDLFLDGGADVMDPIKAVALYSEFRELIPLGKDGDNMTRRLSDRLVSLDLLEEAAELLDHQIKFRLKGVAQSVVASRLAMIYLLDSRPDDALGVLRATRNSQIPDDIRDNRKMIEARALVELGRYDEAEVLIEEYQTKEARDMRSDIYWKSENWDKYISHSNAMLGNRHQSDESLSPKERLAVLRLSVAYVINGDKAGVKALRNRYKAHMDNGLYGDTFEVITAERQLTDLNVRRLTQSIASVAKLETFMESYKAEFTNGS